MSTLKVDTLQDASGSNFLLVRQIIREHNTTNTSHGATYGDAMVGSTYSFKANSRIEWDIYVPLRNDQAGWGGGYVEPNVSINGGSWQSLGTSGYSAVMSAGDADIGFYKNCYYFDPGQSSDFTCRFKIRVASYDGTVTTGGSNNINAANRGHNTTYLSTDSGVQNHHWKTFIIKEWAGA